MRQKFGRKAHREIRPQEEHCEVNSSAVADTGRGVVGVTPPPLVAENFVRSNSNFSPTGAITPDHPPPPPPCGHHPPPPSENPISAPALDTIFFQAVSYTSTYPPTPLRVTSFMNSPLSIRIIKTSYGYFMKPLLETLIYMHSSHRAITGVLYVCVISGVVLGSEFFTRLPALCGTLASVCVVSCIGSLLSILCISVNRYVYICHQGAYNKVRTLKYTVLLGLEVGVEAGVCTR